MPRGLRVGTMRAPAMAPTMAPMVAPMVATVAVTAALLAGCAVGPDPGPDVVTGGGSGAAAESSEAPQQAPELQKPAQDLEWTDCAADTYKLYGVSRAADIAIDCAELSSPINPDAPDGDAVTVSVTRVRTAATPADAPPLVLTSGSDLPSSRTALLIAGGAGRSMIDAHPLVAVDRRGIPQSAAIDCLTRFERTTLADNGLTRGADQARRIEALADAGTSSADGCTEAMDPHQLDFGAADAATDIETLRKKWDVGNLALLGVGEGSDVVLAYAGLFGGRAARVILDTPTAYESRTRERAAMTATGVQGALRLFAQRCGAAGTCPLGTDPLGTIGDVVEKGRNGRLGGLSDTQALAAITTGIALAPATDKGVTDVASAIADADDGDLAALTALAERASELRDSDGQHVARCTDTTGQTGLNEIPNLITDWTKANPLTGTNAALNLVRCTGWSTAESTNPPTSLPAPPLVLNGAGDPINGSEGAGELAATLIRAGVSSTTIAADTLGYSTVARNQCAADAAREYLTTAPLPGPSERTCP